jgi:hypothetical protein
MTYLSPPLCVPQADIERLNLSIAPYAERNITSLIECLDDMVQEQQKVHMCCGHDGVCVCGAGLVRRAAGDAAQRRGQRGTHATCLLRCESPLSSPLRLCHTR